VDGVTERVGNFWRLSRPNKGLVLVWVTILAAWGLLVLEAASRGNYLFHPQLFTRDSSQLGGLKLFFALIDWQVMIVAMMLPSSLPLMRLFFQISRHQLREGEQPLFLLLAFLLAYLTIWTGFALLAFLSASGVHYLFTPFPWWEKHPNWFAGFVLLLAGTFQFSPLKEQCLRACRHPVSFLHHHYQRGLKAAWNLGLHHGLYCLGCCWALMLVMFVAGVGHLAGMLMLTGVMAIEKTSPWSRSLVPVIGTGLIVWGVVILLYPGLLLEMHH
jgi:predicted metal-binding membrane protein